MNSSVQKILDDFGKRVTKLAKINVGAYRSVNGKRRRIDNSGKLRKSIRHETKIEKNEKGFEFIIWAEDYAEYVDKGRKPGKGMPPDKLYAWIKKKPVRIRDLKTGSFVQATESRIKSLAFLINRKIREKGIAPTNFLSDPFNKEFKGLPDNILKAFSIDIDTVLDLDNGEN